MGLFGIKSKPKEVTIDYDKLAEAIVKANKIIKEDEQNLALKQKEQENKEWNETMGYKIYPEDETGIKKVFHSILNSIVVCWNTFNLNPRKIKDDTVVFLLMQSVVSSFFSVLKIILYLGAALFLLLFVLSFFPDYAWSISHKILSLVICIFLFIYGKMFRLAALEIDNMTDRQYVVGIFSGLSAFLALIVAIISLIVAVMK